MSESTNTIRRTFRFLGKIIPKNRTGDRIWSWLRFLAEHKRRPSDSMLFNDFLYRFKIGDEFPKEIYAHTADKELAKPYASDIIGNEYIIPTIAVLRAKDELMNYVFPQKCVIKPTHGTGAVFLRRNGEELPLKKFAKWLDQNTYNKTREIHYRHLEPKIIVEPFAFGDDVPNDFKLFCMNGAVRMIAVDVNRFSELGRNLYLPDWTPLPYSVGNPRSEIDVAKPKKLLQMINIAKKLSQPFHFVRVDLYTNDDEIRFGEITHLPGNANDKHYPPESEAEFAKILFANT